MPWIREKATGRLVEVVAEHPYIVLRDPEWEVMPEPEPEPEPDEPDRRRSRR